MDYMQAESTDCFEDGWLVVQMPEKMDVGMAGRWVLSMVEVMVD